MQGRNYCSPEGIHNFEMDFPLPASTLTVSFSSRQSEQGQRGRDWTGNCKSPLYNVFLGSISSLGHHGLFCSTHLVEARREEKQNSSEALSIINSTKMLGCLKPNILVIIKLMRFVIFHIIIYSIDILLLLPWHQNWEVEVIHGET